MDGGVGFGPNKKNTVLDKAVGSLEACRVPIRTSQVLAFSDSTVVVVSVEAPCLGSGRFLPSVTALRALLGEGETRAPSPFLRILFLP